MSAEREQGVSIPSLRSGGPAHGHRQHTEHQEHVGEGQRVQLTRRWRESLQGTRRDGVRERYVAPQ